MEKVMRKVVKGSCVRRIAAAAMAVSMLMVTACNSKIKVDYGYNPTDYVELGDYKGITADVDVTAITNKVVEADGRPDNIYRCKSWCAEVR